MEKHFKSRVSQTKPPSSIICLGCRVLYYQIKISFFIVFKHLTTTDTHYESCLEFSVFFSLQILNTTVNFTDFIQLILLSSTIKF